MEFIKRDVQNWDKKRHEPKDPKNWHRVYKKLVRENESEVMKDAQQLKATIDGIKNEKSKHTMKRVELDFVKLPEDMHASGPTISLNHKIRFRDRGVLHGKPPSKREIKISRGELDVNTPVRTAKPKTKLGFLRNNATGTPRFQQQTKKPSGIIPAREMALKQKPTNTTITQAPRSMIEEHRRAAIPKPFDPSMSLVPAASPKKRKLEHDEHSRGTADDPPEKRPRDSTNCSSAPRAALLIKAPRSRAVAPERPSPASFPSSEIIQSIQKRSLPVSPPQSQAYSSSSPPPKIMKRKPDADVFMRPKKKPKARLS